MSVRIPIRAIYIDSWGIIEWFGFSCRKGAADDAKGQVHGPSLHTGRNHHSTRASPAAAAAP